MTFNQRLQTRYISLISTSLVLLGTAIPKGIAYTPPADVRAPQGPAIPGGKRGGCDASATNEEDLGFMALAPQQQMGQTLSTQPTLTWFVPDEVAYPIKLQIYKHTSDGWVDVVENLNIGESRQGYMSYTVPASMGLTVGESYRWHVLLVCSADDRSRDQVTGGEFEVVSRPAELGTVTGDRTEQANQYADAGLWYDAMALLASSPLTAEERAYRRELLTKLAEYEDADIGNQLRLIAELE